jgi:glucose dehydrogenase
VVAYLAKYFGKAPAAASSRLPAAPRPAAAPEPRAVPSPPALSADTQNPNGDWPMIGHNAGGDRFSPLAQITPQNVAGLRVAWKYDMMRADEAAAAVAPGAAPARPRMSQVTPVVVNGRMYVTTPYGRAVAIEADTGREIWSYQIPQEYGTAGVRSLTYWPGDDKNGAAIFFGTTRGYLVSLDARSGTPSEPFGQRGAINLRSGAGDDFPQANYGLSSPPAFFKDVVITGSHVQEQPALGPSGDVRGWNARTGKLLWTFHSVPRPGEAGHDVWEGDSWKNRSGGNVWGLMTVDVARGIVFLPIGCVTYDYYGGDRPGTNLFSDTLMALDAATG